MKGVARPGAGCFNQSIQVAALRRVREGLRTAPRTGGGPYRPRPALSEISDRVLEQIE
jgi:hypothetical protein